LQGLNANPIKAQTRIVCDGFGMCAIRRDRYGSVPNRFLQLDSFCREIGLIRSFGQLEKSSSTDHTPVEHRGDMLRDCCVSTGNSGVEGHIYQLAMVFNGFRGCDVEVDCAYIQQISTYRTPVNLLKIIISCIYKL